MSAHQATRCTRRAASSISQPCPSAREPRWRSTCATSSRCRYGPSTCCECAAARGPDDATHASHGRSSAGRRAQTTPCGRAQWARWARSGRRWRCARVGSSTRAQAVAHGAPEAFSAHSQAQLWRRDATSRPMPQLSPEDFLAGSPIVSMWMSCAESSLRQRQHRARTRIRSSLGRATPPHARYCARRQGAGGRRRAVASRARASAAAPPAAAAAAAAASARGSAARALAAKNIGRTRGKLLAATQAEKPHASGRWGAGIRILGLATGLRMPGCVSPSLAARASVL